MQKNLDRTTMNLGGLNTKGYIKISFNGKKYPAHRVAWAIHYGAWPAKQIDHINGVRSDNRITNLRECTCIENARNMKKPNRNTSGFVGVNWCKKNKAWNARIGLNRKRVNLGYFANLNDAVSVRRKAEAMHGFHPNHGRD